MNLSLYINQTVTTDTVYACVEDVPAGYATFYVDLASSAYT